MKFNIRPIDLVSKHFGVSKSLKCLKGAEGQMDAQSNDGNKIVINNTFLTIDVSFHQLEKKAAERTGMGGCTQLQS